jgi:uncharacterized protein (DUF58 family)
MSAEPTHARSASRLILDGDFLRRLERLDLVTKKIVRGELRGERRSQRRGSGVEFTDHRAYAPGDDWRYIDWNVYSRLSELHLKQFEVEENLNLALFVDCSPSMDYGRANKLDFALRIAAAIGYVALSHFDRVCLYPAGQWAGPERGLFTGKGSRLAFLEEIASVEPGGAGAGTGLFVQEMASLFRGPTAVVLLSDFYEAEAMASGLAPTAGRTLDATAIHVVDPLESEPEVSGRVLLTDLETGGSRTLVAGPDVLRAYRARFSAHLRRVESLLASRQVPCLRATTTTPFDGAVLDVLRRGYIFRSAR